MAASGAGKSPAEESGVSRGGASMGIDLYPEVTEEVILPQRIFMFCMGVVLPVLLFDFCFSGIGYGVQVRPTFADRAHSCPMPISAQPMPALFAPGADHEFVDRGHPHPAQRHREVGRDPAGESALQRQMPSFCHRCAHRPRPRIATPRAER